MIQFLLESLLITGLGSAIGLVTAVLGASWMERALEIQVLFTPWSIVLTVVMTLSIGIASGFYPALRAARMSPIEGLRSGLS